MSMVLVITEPDGAKKYYDIGEATPGQAGAWAEVYMKYHPIGSTWAYSVVTSASWDAQKVREETGEWPPGLIETEKEAAK